MRKSIPRDILSSIALVAMFVLCIFPAIEPGLISAAVGYDIAARQEVTAELSMTVSPSTITMLPAIPGLTGGTGYGSTTVNVVTTNSAGFTVTILASTSPAMMGDSQGGQIENYAPASYNTPEAWVDTTAGQSSQFGYTVVASTTADLEDTFESGYKYLAASSTAARTILDTSSETTASGSTSTISFRAHLPANSVPAVPQDWYSATTTVTAAMK